MSSDQTTPTLATPAATTTVEGANPAPISTSAPAPVSGPGAETHAGEMAASPIQQSTSTHSGASDQPPPVPPHDAPRASVYRPPPSPPPVQIRPTSGTSSAPLSRRSTGPGLSSTAISGSTIPPPRPIFVAAPEDAARAYSIRRARAMDEAQALQAGAHHLSAEARALSADARTYGTHLASDARSVGADARSLRASLGAEMRGLSSQAVNEARGRSTAALHDAQGVLHNAGDRAVQESHNILENMGHRAMEEAHGILGGLAARAETFAHDIAGNGGRGGRNGKHRSVDDDEYTLPDSVKNPRDHGLTIGKRLEPTIKHAEHFRNTFARRARLSGYALNIAIGLQVILGALTTGLSVVTSGKQTQIMTAILGGLATIVASFLARARGSGEPERSMMRTRDLEQFVREAQGFVMDRGWVVSEGAGGPGIPPAVATGGGGGAMQGGAISAGGGGMSPWVGARDAGGGGGGVAPGASTGGDEKTQMQQQQQAQGQQQYQQQYRQQRGQGPARQGTGVFTQGPSGGAPGLGAGPITDPADDETRLMQFRARFEELLGASNGERRPVGGV